jgi:hypothetical protein
MPPRQQLATDFRHLAVQQPGDKPQAFVHDRTLLLLQVFSYCFVRYRLLHDRPVFVVGITAARRYAASSIDFEAFVQGTRIKGASRAS